MTWCPEHDPLPAAGFIVCDTCGRRAYPTDANWCGSYVLATFPPPGCAHVRGGVWLVDPAQLTPDTRWCGELTASTGEPCRRRARADLDGRCHDHARIRDG